MVKKEKTSLIFKSSLFILVKEYETRSNPQNTPGGNPKKKKSQAHCSMSRPQVDVMTWNSLDGSLSVATPSFQVVTCLSFNSLDFWSRHQSDVATSFVQCSFSVDVMTSE